MVMAMIFVGAMGATLLITSLLHVSLTARLMGVSYCVGFAVVVIAQGFAVRWKLR
jgi:hypothetical protein